VDRRRDQWDAAIRNCGGSSSHNGNIIHETQELSPKIPRTKCGLQKEAELLWLVAVFYDGAVLDVSVAVALFDNDGVAVMVSTSIAISDHFAFPNYIAVSVTLTDGYTHRTDTYSDLFSNYWHGCPDKYGGRSCR
jgi:hypothetical protein